MFLKMLEYLGYFVFLFAFMVRTCVKAVLPPIVCGELPYNMFSCLDNPQVIKPDVSEQCNTYENTLTSKKRRHHSSLLVRLWQRALPDSDNKAVSECLRMKCVFEKSSWFTEEKVNMRKVAAHFDEFAKDNPVWAKAVRHLKTDCLIMDLPPQGVYVNCPAYDVMQCVLRAFMRYASPIQWSLAPSCVYPRQFAMHCPLCPDGCLAPLVPTGWCNACKVPREAGPWRENTT